MPRHAPRAHWRSLRCCVLSGQWDDARELLEHMVEQYPHDAEAAAELKRLQAGEPLHLLDSPARRRERLRDEALHDIAHAAKLHTPNRLACLPTAALRKLQRDLRRHVRTLSSLHTAAPEHAQAYRQVLAHELSRRRKRSLRNGLLAASGVLVMLGVVGGVAQLLQRRAEDMTNRLQEACRRGEWNQIPPLLAATDSGINRLVHPRSAQVVTNTRNWQAACTAAVRDISEQLRACEDGLRPMGSLRADERAALQRSMAALPPALSAPLMARWQELCRQEQAAVAARHTDAASRLIDALKPPVLSGQMEEDARQLQQAEANLRAALLTGREQHVAEKLLTEAEQLLAQLHELQADISQYRQLDRRLSACRNYEQHCSVLQHFTPRRYAPALAAAQALPQLPTPAEMAATLQQLRLQLPETQAEQESILNAGPSFNAAHPATQSQVHLMEDVFTTRSLQQAVFEVIHPDGQALYAAPQPLITDQGRVVFQISPLDPTMRPGKPLHYEWGPAYAVRLRELNPAPLMQATGINRENFFLTANLAKVMSAITQVHDDTCPVLAKAYLYHTMQELMRLHATPAILGLRFSPTLQADIESFSALSQQHAQLLSPTCWLNNNAATQQAEAAYARWFAEHANRDYAAEMSRELTRLLHEQSRYAGYVNEQQQPILTLQPPPAAQLRYYTTTGQLTSSPAQEPLQQPAPYSPIFID